MTIIRFAWGLMIALAIIHRFIVSKFFFQLSGITTSYVVRKKGKVSGMKSNCRLHLNLWFYIVTSTS